MECPILFDSLLSKSEQEKQLPEEETELFVSIMEDTAHIRPRISSHLQALYCRDFLHLPVCSSALKHDAFQTFNVNLR